MALDGTTPAQTIAPGSTPAATSPPTVPILLEDLQRFRVIEKEYSEFKAAQQAALAAKEQERLDAMAESGKHKQALEETRKSYDTKLGEWSQKYTSLEQTVFAKERDTVIAQALAGKQFNAAKPEQAAVIAAQLHAILSDQFETSRSETGFQVRHKVTGRPATEVLKEALASDQFAHFFAPSNRGGSGTDATRSAGNPQPTSAMSMDALEQSFFARQNQWGDVGLGGQIGSRRGG